MRSREKTSFSDTDDSVELALLSIKNYFRFFFFFDVLSFT